MKEPLRLVIGSSSKPSAHVVDLESADEFTSEPPCSHPRSFGTDVSRLITIHKVPDVLSLPISICRHRVKPHASLVLS